MGWVVYILKCADNTLYTGITNDLETRLGRHQSGKGAKYTRGRGPLELMHQEICVNKAQALRREIEIKKLRRSEKLKLTAIK